MERAARHLATKEIDSHLIIHRAGLINKGVDIFPVTDWHGSAPSRWTLMWDAISMNSSRAAILGMTRGEF